MEIYFRKVFYNTSPQRLRVKNTPLYSVKCSVGRLMTIFNKSLIVNHFKKVAVGQHMKIYFRKSFLEHKSTKVTC